MGKQEYEKTLAFFKVPRVVLAGYEDITCKFSDIYDTSVGTNMEYDYSDVRDNLKLGFSIEPKFNLDDILSMIPEDMLNYKGITKETRELIYKLSFIYDLNEDGIRYIISNSINEKHNIDKELLRDNSRKYYSFENAGKLPSLIYRNQPEYLRKPVGDVSKRAKAIYYFETTSPYDFMYAKNNNTEPSSRELKIIESLMVDFNMNPGVVNVLIDYVLRINQNKLVKSFVDSVASQWVRSKIETVEQAMNLAEKEYKGKKTVTKSVKQVTVPEWFNKNIEEKNASIDEEEEFLKKIKEARGE